MRQIAILHYSAPPVHGGIETTIYHHARLLDQAGYFVRVIAGKGDPSYFETAFHHRVEFFLAPEADPDHPVVVAARQALEQGNSAPFEALRDRLAHLLLPVLADCKLCLVHDAVTSGKNLALTAALHALAAQEVVRLAAWSHEFADPAQDAPDRGYPWSLLRTPWPWVHYVAVSGDRRRRLAALLGLPEEKVAVVPPGIDETGFTKLSPLGRRLAKALELGQADPVILLPTHIHPHTHVEFGLRVAAALVEHKPQTRLLVTGMPRGPEGQAYLETLTGLRRDLGLEDKVVFLFQHGEDGLPLHMTEILLADLYQLAGLFLFPACKEGFGTPVLAAGLARLPVFAADTPALRESTGGMAHFFDPHGSPQAVADAMLAFMQNDPAYRLRRQVLESYTWRQVMQKHLLPLLEGAARS